MATAEEGRAGHERVAVTRVGVTGHRALTVDRDVLSSLVDEVLDTIAGDSGAESIVVVSALAEGADRLVAQRAMDRGGVFEAILPLARDDYATDFAGPSNDDFHRLVEAADAVVELAATPSRDDAYAAAGRALVWGTDALVAVWDGLPARGTGGTAEVVAYARELGRPIAWIHVPPPDEAPRDEPQAPYLTWERFDQLHADRRGS